MSIMLINAINIFLYFFLQIISFLGNIFFYEYSYANTNKLYSTNEYCVIKVDPYLCSQDASFYIQHALNYASYNEDIAYKIVITSLDDDLDITEYNLDKQLKIYSNTWLYIDDSKEPIVFNKNHPYSMIVSHNSISTAESSYGYEGFNNIIIEGGIWNGKTSYVNGSYYPSYYFTKEITDNNFNIIKLQSSELVFENDRFIICRVI